MILFHDPVKARCSDSEFCDLEVVVVYTDVSGRQVHRVMI